MKEIIAIRCPNCGDTYILEEVGLEEDIEYLARPTDCWVCGCGYVPALSAYTMDEFVFKALKRCKAP